MDDVLLFSKKAGKAQTRRQIPPKNPPKTQLSDPTHEQIEAIEFFRMSMDLLTRGRFEEASMFMARAAEFDRSFERGLSNIDACQKKLGIKNKDLA